MLEFCIVLAVFLVPIGVLYPIFMTGVWFILYRSKVSYKDFMRRI